MFKPGMKAVISCKGSPNDGRIVLINRPCDEAREGPGFRIPESPIAWWTDSAPVWVVEAFGSPFRLGSGRGLDGPCLIAPCEQRYLRPLPDEDDIRNFDEDIDEPIAPLTPATT